MFYSAISDKGSIKEINQDSLFIKSIKINQKDCLIGCVCDGLGGLSAGELASCTAISFYHQWFSKVLPNCISSFDNIKVSFAEQTQKINHQIYSFGKKNKFRIGTTVSGVILYNNQYLTFNVGDSRVYLDRDNQIIQLTTDHSFVQQEIDAGRMTKEDAANSKKNNILTKCLGGKEILEGIDFTTGVYRENDTFMFCSDGARHLITEEEYHLFLSQISSKNQLDKNLPKILDIIMNRGEMDNISIGVIRI